MGRLLMPGFAVLIVLVATAWGSGTPAPLVAESRPNFVVFVIDDLDRASVEYMNSTNRRIVRTGMTFSNFFASTPLCCPSRASLLRGQYAHNHGVLRNTGEDAGFSKFHASGHEEETLATMLDSDGYETALVGKYLNGYSLPGSRKGYVPPGWDYWVSGVDHSAYSNFNYQLNINGELVDFGHREQDYLTDVLSGHALEFLEQASASQQPFFLYLAPYAPHSPATPAPRHKGMFRGVQAPRTPAFNERNVRDKPRWVRSTSRLSKARVERIDDGFSRRLASLQAVDEMISAVVDRLERQNQLENTYLIFLSDNGYFLGEHRQPHGKDAPHDAASRIPLFVSGPGVSPGSETRKIALNIDLFPTLLDLAGSNSPSFVDGRSLTPLLHGQVSGWRRAALIEGFGKETESNGPGEASTPPFRALRTERILYVEYESGERELYDLRKDPYQTANVASRVSKSLRRIYSRRLRELASCRAAECRRVEDAPLASRDRDRDKTRRASRERDEKPAKRQHERRDRRPPEAHGRGSSD